MAEETQQTPAGTASPARSKEVLIAIIGLVGVLATAGFSNWDKIFPPKNVVKSEFSGYQPTGDPQIELRYFIEITGMRSALKQMQMGMIDHFKRQTEALPGARPETVAKAFKILEDDLPTQYDEIVNAFVPIASKHFSVAELQELNKFYSTPVMRELIRKQPIMNSEFLPVAMAQMQKTQERVGGKITALFEAELQQGPNAPPPRKP